MRLLTKGLLLIAVPGLIELALVTAVFDAQQRTARAEQGASTSRQVLYQASALVDPLLREAARVRTAIVVSDASFIDQRGVWIELTDRLTRLEALVAGNAQQIERLRRMRSDVEAYRLKVAALSERLDNLTAPLTAAQMKEAFPLTGEELPSEVAAFRSELDAFLADESQANTQQSESLARNRQRQQLTLMAAVLASMLVWAVAALLFARNIGNRLAALTANAKRLGSDQRLTVALSGNDEISALDAVLHQTAARLRIADREQAALKDRLEERAEELARVNEELRQETQDNEMFIYSVSHDLRSPLVNLQGFSKELQVSCDELRATVAAAGLPDAERSRLTTVLDGDVEESLGFLRSAVTRAAAIIEALLRISRAGRLEYQWQRVQVGQVVRRVVDSLQTRIDSRGARIELQELPPAWGDPGAIGQVFTSLIGNAVNFLDPGRPGVIEVGALEPEPPGEPHVTRTRTYYVRDNGLGIPAAYMPKMFHAFQRLHGDVSQGDGVDLAVVRRIVERLGGRVWVESEEGRGSTFFAALPEQAMRRA
ncbi:sensor histidine kinase [Paraburkholderia phosphatilytica]|uniref:sensor histidine kinase n=1 Tax=Paraburkholderia phosphatilytica TaxID=2282883 RepID=UPI000E4BAC0B|nr:ATP-binding protein [Paraburkholderia phosphatilytica]